MIQITDHSDHRPFRPQIIQITQITQTILDHLGQRSFNHRPFGSSRSFKPLTDLLCQIRSFLPPKRPGRPDSVKKTKPPTRQKFSSPRPPPRKSWCNLRCRYRSPRCTAGSPRSARCRRSGKPPSCRQSRCPRQGSTSSPPRSACTG